MMNAQNDPDKQVVPNEIIGMILSELSAAGRLRPKMRLVSKAFDAMVLPLIYAHFTLNKESAVIKFETLESERDPQEYKQLLDRCPGYYYFVQGKYRHVLDQIATSAQDRGFSTWWRPNYCQFSIFDLEALLKNVDLGHHVNEKVLLGIAKARRIKEFAQVLSIDMRFWSWLETMNFVDFARLKLIKVYPPVMLSRRKTIPKVFGNVPVETHLTNLNWPVDRSSFLTPDDIPGPVAQICINDWHTDPQFTQMSGNHDLQKRLCDYRDVKVLHLRAIKQSYPWIPPEFDGIWSPARQRLPPYEEVLLENCNFNYPDIFANEFFDWSRIVHLELRSVPISAFLGRVHPQLLATLQTFLTDGCAVYKPADREWADKLICCLFRWVKALRRLAFFGEDLATACVPALFSHGQTLCELDIRKFDSNGRKTFDRQYLDSSANYLPLLVAHFPKLTDLTVEYPTSQPCTSGTEAWASHIAKCRNLRRLHVIGPYIDDDPQATEEHPIMLQHLVETLCSMKEGALFEEITYSRTSPCWGPRCKSPGSRISMKWHGGMKGDQPILDLGEPKWDTWD